MQSELSGKISYWPRPQNSGMPGAPGAVGLEIFALAAESVVDAAVKHQFPRAALDLRERNLCQQGDGIVIELSPPHRIQVAEQAA